MVCSKIKMFNYYRSGSALPSNSSSTITGLDSLTSVAGRGAAANYHAAYIEGALAHQVGVGNNLPLNVQAHQLRYGRNSENRESEIRSGLHNSGNMPQQYAAHPGDPYPISLSSMSPTTGVNKMTTFRIFEKRF